MDLDEQLNKLFLCEKHEQETENQNQVQDRFDLGGVV